MAIPPTTARSVDGQPPRAALSRTRSALPLRRVWDLARATQAAAAPLRVDSMTLPHLGDPRPAQSTSFGGRPAEVDRALGAATRPGAHDHWALSSTEVPTRLPTPGHNPANAGKSRAPSGIDTSSQIPYPVGDRCVTVAGTPTSALAWSTPTAAGAHEQHRSPWVEPITPTLAHCSRPGYASAPSDTAVQACPNVPSGGPSQADGRARRFHSL
jgi:hypothetical protein